MCPSYADPWRERLLDAMRLACAWLTQRSQLREEPPESPDTVYRHPHTTWRGTFREYDPSLREWRYYAPVWHTGQAVRALLMAHRLFPDAGCLDAARLGVKFIRAAQVTEGEDAGLIRSYESKPGDIVRIPGNLECHLGLIDFAEATGEGEWWNIVTGSLDWLLRKAYVPGAGTLRNIYHPVEKAFKPYTMTPCGEGGKPTGDDGIFFRAWRRTGDRRYRDAGLAIADRLARDERPPGNWDRYGPSRQDIGCNHPRQAYWYGLPMLLAYDETGDEKYLRVAERSAEWFMQAQRADGGQFRNTYNDGKTDSFGHEASGAACGAIFWIAMHGRSNNPRYVPFIRRALDFLMRMQITRPEDPNLAGALISGVLPPDGTDRPRYRVRDLASIFFIQAAAQLLENDALCRQVAA